MFETNANGQRLFRVAGLRWWIAALLFAATLISYIDRLTLSILAPTICLDLHLSNFQYATISAWFLLAYSLGQSVFGRLQDRFGTKLGLSLAMMIWSAAETAQALTYGLLGFCSLRFVLGLGEGGHWPAAIKGVGEWFPKEQRGIGMGIINSGATLGSMLAPPLIVALELNFGWRTTFVATGLLGFIWLLPWGLYYQSPRKHPLLGACELVLIQGAANTGGSPVPSPTWSALLKDNRVRGVVLARLLGDPVWWLYLAWLPLYLSRARGLTLREIGISAWIPFLCADIGALAGGWFSGWLIQCRWKPAQARGAAIALAAALSPVAMLVSGARSETAAIALISVALFAFQFWVNNVQTLTCDLFQNELVASISGLAGTGAGLGALVFTLSTGWIVDHFGYAPVLILSGLLLPLGTAALGWFAGVFSRQNGI